MSALAYVLPPLSGAVAYLKSSSPTVRFHGLQSVILGVVWPIALYVGSAISRLATNVVFAAGFLVWAVLLVTTARGGAFRLPLVGSLCARLAETTDAR
ncbi:MAG TPA: hypothetical protein VHJ82_03995 [Actinomycetota bacterium]|nr:hypothetical protein [Actinomycetota bacterium]